jgi:hypothetical protein
VQVFAKVKTERGGFRNGSKLCRPLWAKRQIAASISRCIRFFILSSGRQLDHEATACTGLALDRDAPTVGLDDASHDRQPQAAALDISASASIEPLKDAWLVGRGDAWAAILHPQPHALMGLFGADLYLPPGGGEFQSVLQEVGQGQLDPRTVAMDLHRRRWLRDRERDVFLVRQRLESGRRRPDQFSRVVAGHVQRDQAGVESR